MEVELKHFIKLVIFINCRKKKKISYLDFLNRQNKITCSHIHIIYIFKFYLKLVFLFPYVVFHIFESFVRKYKNFFRKVYDNISISYYLLNVGIIINLFPLIPYGNF